MADSRSMLSASSSLTGLTLNDLPNLPGVRRDVSAINPKLYKQYTASRAASADDTEQGKPLTPATNGIAVPDALEEFSQLFDSPDKMSQFSKTLSAFPDQATQFNDTNGRYSLVSQKRDRLSKSRSLPYYSLENVPAFVTNESKVCTFLAYFYEKSLENDSISARKVEIRLFLEDNTISVTEPKVENAGSFQGKFLRRHQIFKPTTRISPGKSTGMSGTLMYTLADFYAGAELDFYSRIYYVVDCDMHTKMHMAELGTPFGTPVPMPANLYDPRQRPGISRQSVRTTKTKARAKLGFFEYDRKVLRFFGVWDCRGQLFGDELHVRVHYYLADDTIEIVPIPTRNSGRDKIAKYIKKSKILRPLEEQQDGFGGYVSSASSTDSFSVASLTASGTHLPPGSANGTARSGMSRSRSLVGQIAAVPPHPSEYYHWRDLKIGTGIAVASLNVLLLDADEFTREFYNSKLCPLGMPIQLPEAVFPNVETTTPPYNGFGSEEDSMATCKKNLIPTVVASRDGKKAKLFQGMVLRFKATMKAPKETDRSRSFIIQYHLEDDTIQIREPPQRNSGHKGGIFLRRSKIETHGDDSLPPPPEAKDLFVGAEVKIHAHEFILLDADPYTLKYMEGNPKLWRFSDVKYVSDKIYRKAEVVKHVLLTHPNLANKVFTSIEELSELLVDKAGLQLMPQEVITVFRYLDSYRTGVLKYSKLLKYTIDLMAETDRN